MKNKKNTDEKIKFELEIYKTNDEVFGHIANCEGKHTQQVVYSTYHKGITQICFGCKKIRTTIKNF